MDLTSLEDLTQLLRKHNLWAKKSLGQHFLVNEKPLEIIVNTSDLHSTDTVVEIGPGCGVLTVTLAPHVGTLHAVELDKDIIPVLEETTKQFQNVVIHHQDIRTFTPPTNEYKVIANIPYYLTGKILRYFLEEAGHRPALLVLMTQKEVAEKIVAQPPNANLLSTAVQTLGAPDIITTVPAQSFYPPPSVDSAIIKIKAREPEADLDLKQYFRIVRAAFQQSRKQIHNGLSANLGLEPEQVKQWLSQCDINPSRRPGTLTIEEWSCLEKHTPLRMPR